MKKNDFGYVRVAAARPIVQIAQPQENVQEMISMTQMAAEKCVQVVVFPELGITGYSCGDLFLQEGLLCEVEHFAAMYVQATKDLDLICIFGMPLRVGDQLFNVAVVCRGGVVLAIIPKMFMPNYKEFYELRHFSPADRLLAREVCFCGNIVPIGTDIIITTNIPHFSFGVEICEDLWLPIPPSSHAVTQGATVIFNLSASNETIGKSNYRRALVQNQSARCVCAYVYTSCGCGESTSDVVWSGHMIIADNGVIVAEQKNVFLKRQLLVADIDVQRLGRERRVSGSFSQAVGNERNVYGQVYRHINTVIASINYYATSLMQKVNPLPFVPQDVKKLDDRCEEIIQLQIAGLVQRLASVESVICRNVVIGISGGLDSTLALLATVRTFDELGWDRSGVIAVTMPGFGTTDRTKRNAITLCKMLGVTLKKIPIKKITLQLLKDIGHDPCMQCLTCENSQARIRTLILMSLGFVIGTGDLSELMLGWCTYNGDHMSMYNPNCGVPKTLVKFVVEQMGKSGIFGAQASKILMDICATPISPELLPGQNTEVSIGSYDLNDFFIFHMMRNGHEPQKIHFLACLAFANIYDPLTIKERLVMFYKRVFAAQFKRNAMPDGIKIGSVAVSPRGDWRAPSDATGKLWIKMAESIEV